MSRSFSISVVLLVATIVTACAQAAPTVPSSAAPPAGAALALVTPRSPSGPPIEPPNPLHLQNALDFYLKANGVLGAIQGPEPPPITPQWTEALNGIIGEANTTLTRLPPECQECSPEGPPIFQAIISQANLTKSLATALGPEGPPI